MKVLIASHIEVAGGNPHGEFCGKSCWARLGDPRVCYAYDSDLEENSGRVKRCSECIEMQKRSDRLIQRLIREATQ